MWEILSFQLFHTKLKMNLTYSLLIFLDKMEELIKLQEEASSTKRYQSLETTSLPTLKTIMTCHIFPSKTDEKTKTTNPFHNKEHMVQVHSKDLYMPLQVHMVLMNKYMPLQGYFNVRGWTRFYKPALTPLRFLYIVIIQTLTSQ